ncbi:MAG: hypothetical protein P1P84_04940 [Deferrisomatales bacterium]|nr:hypothetical protein [Deferrisomatales bacterium]
MLDEPNICRESYQVAQVVILARSKSEALTLLDADGRWDLAALQRLPPEVVPLATPRILTWQIDPF